ncbi:MAG: hypothetical protein K8R36_21520 [Planctomycetales bacterium]|nr:hypothetical protein [Planctomycetales bacterium]
MSKDRRLGRGLAALLGAPLFDEQNTSGASGDHQNDMAKSSPTLQGASTSAGFTPPIPSPASEKPAIENGGLLQLAVDESSPCLSVG